jgi:hypothetical protein
VKGWRLIVSAAIGAVAVVGGILWGADLLGRGPVGPIVLARPAPGEARPDHLPDGTPVWVMGHDDGSADVLLGFDPHRPFGLGKMMWWCEAARALDNPHHGSKWDEYGVRIGGPAPEGLRSYDVRVERDRLLLGELRDAPPYGARATGPPESDRQWCRGEDGAVTYHRFEGWRVWDSPAAAVAADPEGWILLDGQLLADPEQGVVLLCAPAGCEDRAIAANVEVPPPDLEFGPLVAGRFIAQVDGGRLVGVSQVIVLERAEQ